MRIITQTLTKRAWKPKAVEGAYCILVLILVSTIALFAEIPNDEDLLLWIGEGSGNVASDLTGNGNDGTLHGSAQWIVDEGKFASGIVLKGMASFIEVPNVIAERGSLTFWFKPDWDGEDPMDYRIFDASFPPIYFFIGKGASERDITPAEFGFYFEAADDTDWQDVEFDPAGVIEENKWFHVAITWDFAGGYPFLYIDGTLIATSIKITGGFPRLYEKPRFGWETVPYVPMRNGAEGIIDEISFWQRVLNTGEIEYLMAVSLLTDVKVAGKLTTLWSRLKAASIRKTEAL